MRPLSQTFSQSFSLTLLQPRSLQARLLILVVSVMAGVWLATSLLTWFDARHEIDELLDGHLAQAASLLVVQQGHESAPPSAASALHPDGRYPDAPLLHRYSPRVAYQVFRGGQLVTRSANAPHSPMIDLGEHFDSGFRTVTLDSPSGRAPGAPLVATRWRVFATRDADKGVQVYIGERSDSRSEILRAVLRSTLWPMLLSLPLLALAAWWAIYRGVAPLRRLGRQLARRQPQALHPVVISNAPAEMRPMLDALNQLFGRIGQLMEAERRFTADAAHELRTPIAAIRTQAQVALGEPDAAERRHALLATLEGCDRATRLVEQLLTLSRLEAGADTGLEAIDLHALARRVVADLAPQALDKRQELELERDQEPGAAPDAGGPATVRGNATLLAVLLRNLVDNAIRYSPVGAAVQIRLTVRDGEVTLRVEDSGPGLAAADLDRLGERFFRVLGSGQPGSGLGWSIAKRVAAVHQFSLETGRSPRLGGLMVSLRCPSVTASG